MTFKHKKKLKEKESLRMVPPTYSGGQQEEGHGVVHHVRRQTWTGQRSDEWRLVFLELLVGAKQKNKLLSLKD